MRTSTKAIVAMIVSVAAAGSIQADTLVKKDGAQIEGRFVRGDSSTIWFSTADRPADTYPVNEVAQIHFNASNQAFDRSYRNGRRQAGKSVLVPAGTEMSVRLIDPVDSDRDSVGQSYRASLAEPVLVDGATVVPQGADATVKLVNTQDAGRIRGNEEVMLALSQVTVNGKTYDVKTGSASVTSEGKGGQSAKVIGGTAALGAIIGAIAGGGKGAAIGAASGAGAGAAIQVARGTTVKVPSETTLRFTVAEPVNR